MSLPEKIDCFIRGATVQTLLEQARGDLEKMVSVRSMFREAISSGESGAVLRARGIHDDTVRDLLANLNSISSFTDGCTREDAADKIREALNSYRQYLMPAPTTVDIVLLTKTYDTIGQVEGALFP